MQNEIRPASLINAQVVELVSSPGSDAKIIELDIATLGFVSGGGLPNSTWAITPAAADGLPNSTW